MRSRGERRVFGEGRSYESWVQMEGGVIIRLIPKDWIYTYDGVYEYIYEVMGKV